MTLPFLNACLLCFWDPMHFWFFSENPSQDPLLPPHLTLPQELFYLPLTKESPWAIPSILQCQLLLHAVDSKFQSSILDLSYKLPTWLQLPTWYFPRVPRTPHISNWTQSFPQTYSSSSRWLILCVDLATDAQVKHCIGREFLQKTSIWIGEMQCGWASPNLWEPEQNKGWKEEEFAPFFPLITWAGWDHLLLTSDWNLSHWLSGSWAFRLWLNRSTSFLGSLGFLFSVSMSQFLIINLSSIYNINL